MDSPQEISTRRLSQYYVSALLLIGCLALASHLIQRMAAHNIEGMAEIINVSGRQRMLSQRIASLVAQYELGDPGARVALNSAIVEFELAHWRLSRGDLAYNSSPNEPRLIQELYFDGPHPVDTEMRDFIASARRASSLAVTDPALPAVAAGIFAESRTPLINALDHVVLVRQEESDSKFHRLRALQIAILIVMFVSLMLEAQFIFRPMIRKILAFGGEILRLASTDSLTGVANRRGFLALSAVEFTRSRRYSHPLCLLMLDVDRFKQINDTYGHAAGDAALVALSRTLEKNLRPSDIVGRVGGEEFAILLPETSLEGAGALAERLREQAEAMRFQHGGQVIAFTVSVGVTEVDSVCASIEAAMQAADHFLYRAKSSGLNRIVDRQTADVPA